MYPVAGAWLIRCARYSGKAEDCSSTPTQALWYKETIAAHLGDHPYHMLYSKPRPHPSIAMRLQKGIRPPKEKAQGAFETQTSAHKPRTSMTYRVSRSAARIVKHDRSAAPRDASAVHCCSRRGDITNINSGMRCYIPMNKRTAHF